jgi:TolB-like protein
MEADTDEQSICKGFNLPDEPSIEVFPFVSMDGDPMQE